MAIPIYLPESFKRKLGKKEPPMVASISECVMRLSKDPSHPGLNMHKMGGTKGVWEAYVDDANRVTFEWVQGGIQMRSHCNHDILKRNP